VVTDDRGVEQIYPLRIRLNLPNPPISRDRRLVVRSVGVDKFRGRVLPGIKFAEWDARKLAEFLVAPAQKKRFRRIDAKVLQGAGATSQAISQMFERLAAEIRERTLRAGDTVFLVIESHVLKLGAGNSLVLGADADAQTNKMSPEPAVSAHAISEQLEEVTAEGCLVLLLLDGIHEYLPVPLRGSVITEWVRDLNKRGVIVLVASKQEPSERLDKLGAGAFAQAILDSVTIAGSAARLGNPGAAISPTLDDFQATVVNRVKELTRRQQFADFFPPEYLDWSDIRIFEPQPAPVENVAKR
jgi:hypothetical protein